jgi:ATP/ADP translocase
VTATLSPEERVPGVKIAAGTAVALIAQQVAGKAVRDTLFLSSFESRFLPLAMALAAIASVAVVFWLSHILVRRSPAKAMPWLFVASAAGLVLSWCVGLVSPAASALMAYFHTSLLGPVLITTFWSLIDERFDPHTAKRAVARISAGGALGGVLGGLAAWRASSIVPVPTMLLLLAALNAVCAVGSLFLRTREEGATRESLPPIEPTKSAFGLLRHERLLRNLASLVGLVAILSALLDYIFSAQAAATLPKGAPLLSFFSLFWLGVGVISLVLQLALGRLALEKLGLAKSIAVMPATIVVGSAFGLALPGLASLSILRGVDAVQRNTLFRSAYELLYTPITEEKKRSTKGLIDVGFDRAGTLVGSLLVVATLALATQLTSTILLLFIALTSLLTLPVIVGLHRGYVRALEQGLLAGAKAGPDPPSAIEVKASSDARDVLIDRESPSHDKSSVEARQRSERLIADTRDLLSGDDERAKRVLEKEAVELRSLAAWIIPLLAQPRLYRDALRALSRIANDVTGQLVDALLDPATKTAVRRRVPRALAACGTQRAADGLLLGLADRSFEVRCECSKALSRVVARNERIHVPKETLAEAILRELQDEAKRGDREQTAELAAELAVDQRERQLNHMFAILSVHLDRAALKTAFSALHRADERGMALEYLETVLPNDLKAALMPFFVAIEALPSDEGRAGL